MCFCDVIRKGVEVLVRREKVKKSEIKGYAISFSILSAFGGDLEVWGCDLIRGSKVKICDCGVKLRWYFCGSGDLVIF